MIPNAIQEKPTAVPKLGDAPLPSATSNLAVKPEPDAAEVL
jgi:hypothetical protein